jgi:hypothetical protein
VGLDYANCNHWFWFYKYFRIRKAMVSGMKKKKIGTAGSGYYIDLKRVAGFHERSHKRTCIFLGD